MMPHRFADHSQQVCGVFYYKQCFDLAVGVKKGEFMKQNELGTLHLKRRRNAQLVELVELAELAEFLKGLENPWPEDRGMLRLINKAIEFDKKVSVYRAAVFEAIYYVRYRALFRVETRTLKHMEKFKQFLKRTDGR